MRYEHRVSLDWLRARQRVITASDVRRMLPDLKRLEAGKLKLEQCRSFAKVLGAKTNRFPDVEAPSSAAARGHFLEPYAVTQWNSENGSEGRMWHWDDFLLTSESGLGFSPDALDVLQPAGVERRVGADGSFDGVVPTRLLEVKCYEDGAHWQRKLDQVAGVEHEERWQVAVAMCVCPSIEVGTVMWYAPQCDDWFSSTYDRADLAEEMETAERMVERWREFLDMMRGSPHVETALTEEDLCNAYLAERMLDAM